MNCFLRDIVKACRPVRVTVTGEFASRGGLSSRMVAAHVATHVASHTKE